MRKAHPIWLESLLSARRILTPRPPESLPASNSRTGGSARALIAPSPTLRSALCPPNLNGWPSEHCASEPEPFFHRLVGSPVPVAACRLALIFLFLVGLSA